MSERSCVSQTSPRKKPWSPEGETKIQSLSSTLQCRVTRGGSLPLEQWELFGSLGKMYSGIRSMMCPYEVRRDAHRESPQN